MTQEEPPEGADHTQPTVLELANGTAGATRGGGSCSSGGKRFHSSQTMHMGGEVPMC